MNKLIEAAKALAATYISECPHCDGTGKQYPGKCKDACHRCGGCGEVCADVWPDDIRAVRAALADLQKEQTK